MSDRQMTSSAAASANPPRLAGYIVELATRNDLLFAAESIRDAGYQKWDAHTPFPVHGLNDAMGLKPTRLPYFSFLCGITGTAFALWLQWWTNAHDYALNISGKPFWSVPANIPVVFELTVLFAAIGTFLGMLVFNGLPRYYHPVFNAEKLKGATTDRFLISVEAADPKFDAARTLAFLASLPGAAVDEVYEEGGDAA